MSKPHAAQLIEDYLNYTRIVARDQAVKTIALIDLAITSGDRDILKTKDYIPETAEALRAQTVAGHRAILGGIDAANELVRTPNAQTVMGSALVMEIVDKMINGALENARVSYEQKSVLIDDVWQATGDMSPETIVNLQALKSRLEAAIRANEQPTAVPRDRDDLKTKLLTATLCVMMCSILQSTLTFTLQKQGIDPAEIPATAPDPQEILVVRDFIEAHDHVLAEIAADIEEMDVATPA